jgi:hypothetical protein
MFFLNFGLTYERRLNPKMSLGINFNFTVPRGLPFSRFIETTANEWLDGTNFSGVTYSDFKFKKFGVSPELRFYTKEKAISSFYFSLYATYNYYGIDPFEAIVPGTMSGGNTEASFAISTSNFTGGFAIGNQWVLGGGFTIDLTWIGFGFGAGWVKGSGTSLNPLNPADFDAIASDINSIFFGNKIFDISAESTSDSLSVTGRVLIPTIRLFNFSIGFTF